MAQVLIRQLDDEIVRRIKERATRHGRSMEAEIREILRLATLDPVQELEAIRTALAGRRFTPSSDLLKKR